MYPPFPSNRSPWGSNGVAPQSLGGVRRLIVGPNPERLALDRRDACQIRGYIYPVIGTARMLERMPSSARYTQCARFESATDSAAAQLRLERPSRRAIARGSIAPEPSASQPIASQPITSQPITSQPGDASALGAVHPDPVDPTPANPIPANPNPVHDGLGQTGARWARARERS